MTARDNNSSSAGSVTLFGRLERSNEILLSKTIAYTIAVYLTIILRNRGEYHLILSRRGRRPSWLNQGIFRKIEQDNCFIIQQIPIDYHFQNEKNYGSMIKTLKASNT